MRTEVWGWTSHAREFAFAPGVPGWDRRTRSACLTLLAHGMNFRFMLAKPGAIADFVSQRWSRFFNETTARTIPPEAPAGGGIMKAKTWAFVMLALMVWVGAAQAATVNVSWGSTSSYTSYNQGSHNVAQFNLTFDDGFSTYGFCVAPTISISQGNYNYSFLDWTDGLLKAAWLFDTYASTAGAIDTRDERVAIQSSIWAVSSNYGYRPVWYDSARTTFNDWYDAAQGTMLDVDYLMKTYKIVSHFDDNGKTYQALIVKYPSQVPVPAAVWMLGSGLLAVVVMRRKRQV